MNNWITKINELAELHPAAKIKVQVCEKDIDFNYSCMINNISNIKYIKCMWIDDYFIEDEEDLNIYITDTNDFLADMKDDFKYRKALQEEVKKYDNDWEDIILISI